MKSLRLVSVCVLCALPTMLYGEVVNGIEVLSQDYFTKASWTESWRWHPPEQINSVPYPVGDWCAGYDVSPSGIITGGYLFSTSSGSPMAASTAAPSPLTGPPLTASASIDLFSVHNRADSVWTGFSYPAPMGGTATYGGWIETSVSASWIFRPIGGSFDVDVNASFYNFRGPTYAGITATLMDVTPGHYSTLLNLVNANLIADYTFTATPGDVYQLSVSASSDTFSDDFGSQNFTASIMSVPEPSALSLLVIGIAGLGIARSGHRTKHSSTTYRTKRINL